MLVRRQVTVHIGLFSSNKSYLSLFDLATGDDAIFGLLYFFFGLVELGLKVSALLQSGELCLTLRKGLELRVEFLVKLQEGIQVAAEYYIVLWQAFLQQRQVFLELLDLFCVLLFFGAEMCAYEDVFIRALNCKTFPPIFYFASTLFRNELANLSKGE